MDTREVVVELKRVSYIDVEVNVDTDKPPKDWLGLAIEQLAVDDKDIDYIVSAVPLETGDESERLRFEPDPHNLAELLRIMKEYRIEAESIGGVSTPLLQQIAEQLDACCDANGVSL